MAVHFNIVRLNTAGRSVRSVELHWMMFSLQIEFEGHEFETTPTRLQKLEFRSSNALSHVERKYHGRLA